MENKKKIIMVVLSVLVCVMAVGYAILSQQLNINGTASIDSTWKIEITNITEKDIVGNATSKEVPSYTSTTANFSVGLIQPGDSITYDIEISNLGTLAARVGSINITKDNNDAITYTTKGIRPGERLDVNEKDTLSVTVTYDSSVTAQPTKTANDLTVTINYVQDLGENTPITYDTYTIGDMITFAGNNWYVIKDSNSEEDYVTLLKETVLTNTELEDYAYNRTYNTMPYYWSDTCHDQWLHNYTSYDYSGCANHNDYEGSKVKEFLEGTYLNTLGSDNLKTVDGYKIRLITLNELQTNLGYDTEITASYYKHNQENTPSWVYRNFGERIGNVSGYWTMTANTDNSSSVWFVYQDGNASNYYIYNNYTGVRPVINLLKTSIE